jgi:hypothetical protein
MEPSQQQNNPQPGSIQGTQIPTQNPNQAYNGYSPNYNATTTPTLQQTVVNRTQMYQSAQSGSLTYDRLAIGGLIASIFSLVAWLIPLCGCPTAVAGIACSIFGMRSQTKRTIAIVALIISVIGLLLTIVNSVYGAMIGYQQAIPSQ